MILVPVFLFLIAEAIIFLEDSINKGIFRKAFYVIWGGISLLGITIIFLMGFVREYDNRRNKISQDAMNYLICEHAPYMILSYGHTADINLMHFEGYDYIDDLNGFGALVNVSQNQACSGYNIILCSQRRNVNDKELKEVRDYFQKDVKCIFSYVDNTSDTEIEYAKNSFENGKNNWFFTVYQVK